MRSPDPTRAFVLSLLGPRPRSPGGVEWVRAVELLRLHHLSGLAVSRSRAAAGGLLPQEVERELEADFRAVEMSTTLRLEAGERARELLEGAGIPALYFKGAALVRSGAYPGPGARPMDDVDLLVPAGRAREAARVLAAGGFRPWVPWNEGREGWLDSFTLTLENGPPGVSQVVDLHWRAEYGDLRFGVAGSEPGALWRDARLDEGLPAPEPHLLVVAEHVLKHLRYQAHFRGLADLTLLAGEVEDWDRFLDLARGRPQAPAVGLLLDLAREELEAVVPSRVASALGGRGPWMRPARFLIRPGRLLGRRRPVPGRASGLLLRWLLAGSPARAAGDAVRAAFPRPEWLRARYGAGPREASLARLRARYWADLVRWLLYRGRSPASPNQELFGPRERW